MEKDRKDPGISLFVYYFSKQSMLSISPLSSTQAKTRLTQNRHNSKGAEDKKRPSHEILLGELITPPDVQFLYNKPGFFYGE